MRKPLVILAIAFVSIAIVSVASWSLYDTYVAKSDSIDDGTEPDMPLFLNKVKGAISKEEFMRMRADAIAMRRGISKDHPFDPKRRQDAVKEMVVQEQLVAQRAKNDPNLALPNWTAIGPAPIPNGQTTTTTTAVSGRTIAIAIHPTNPMIVYAGTAQGGLYRTTNGGTSWTPLMDSALSLAIGALAISPSQPETLYVGTGEPNFSSDSYFGVGVYRIDNASTTATLSGPFNQDAVAADIFSGRAIGEIIVHPTDPDIIFVASTSGVGGLRAVNSVFPSRGIYRSTNATSATPVFAKLTGLIANGNISVHDIAIDPLDPNILVAVPIATGANQGGIYQSTNALNADPTTVTFTQRFLINSTSTSTLNGELTAIHPVADTNATFYAAMGNLTGRVYKSTDGGVTWVVQAGGNNFCNPQCFYDIAVAVDPTNVNTVYLGGAPGLIAAKSINGGTSFVDNNNGLHVDTHALAVSPSDPTNVWLGTDGGIYKSINSGVNWTNQNSAQFSATQFMGLDVHPTDPNFSLGGTQDNGTSVYCPTCPLPFIPWFRVDFGDGGWAVIDQNATDNVNVRMYHTYFNAVNLQGYGTVSTTAAAFDGNWTFRGCQTTAATVNGITCNGTINFYAPLERGPGTPNTIYYGSDRLYRSADNGTNHTVVSQNPIVSGVPISSIGIARTNDLVRIVGLNGGQIFGTTTGANPLVDLDPGNTVPNLPINRTIIDPTNANTAYVTLSTFAASPIWKTSTLSSLNSGLAPTWTDASTGLPQVPVNAIVVDKLNPNIVYAGTDIGVYFTVNGGTSWQPYGQGLPRVAIFGIQITNSLPRQVRIATHGRGMFQAPAALGPTAAAVSVRGKVMTANGSGVANAGISVVSSTGTRQVATSNSFGYYRFNDLQAGETYTFTVGSKQYQFTPRVVNLSEDLSEFNFVASK